MLDAVLSLLLTTLPITGNQQAELDFRVQIAGESPPAELAAYRLTNPFKNRTQMTNHASLCATLDWDATRMFGGPQHTPDDLRVYSACFLSTASTANSLKFLRLHAREWQTNWTANAIEEAILKRLAIESPADADAFTEKLTANPDNLPCIRWVIWQNLVKERRKAEAADYARREQLETSVSFSQSFQCLPFEPPFIQLCRPDKVRNEIWQYCFGTRQWIARVAPPPGKTIYLKADWEQPSGPKYFRTWQKGPSWQVTYVQQGTRLTRSSSHVEADSYIAGRIEPGGYAETVVELSDPPRGFIYKTPACIEVQ